MPIFCIKHKGKKHNNQTLGYVTQPVMFFGHPNDIYGRLLSALEKKNKMAAFGNYVSLKNIAM